MSDADKRVMTLKATIYNAVIESRCTADEAAEALLTMAAGRAIAGNMSCHWFEENAHALFHLAEKAIAAEQAKTRSMH